jgi:hypothetical protein
MRALFSVYLLFFVALLFVQTGCKHPSEIPADKEVAIAQRQWADCDLNALKAGYQLYQAKCDRCHELYKPEAYSEDEWEDILPKMSRKAHISAEEQTSIRHYLLTRRIYILETRKK